MKFILSLSLLAVLGTSCSSMKKEEKKVPEYNPEISYMNENKTFSQKVELPTGFKDKIPLVVIVHEWWGRNDYIEMREEMLKKEGFATIAVDLFGDGKVVETPKEAMELVGPIYKTPQIGVDRLNRVIQEAKKDPHVDPAKIYVIGYCFGGTQALNVARAGVDVKGVVSFHGGLTPAYPSQGIKAKVLAINGLADPMVPAKDRAAFEKEMKSLKASYKVVNYKGATHAFTNPKATEVGKKFKIPVAYNKAADEGSWKELMKFLKE